MVGVKLLKHLYSGVLYKCTEHYTFAMFLSTSGYWTKSRVYRADLMNPKKFTLIGNNFNEK